MTKYRLADGKPDWPAMFDDLDAMLVIAREQTVPLSRGLALAMPLHHARAMVQIIEDEDRGFHG